MSSSDQCPSSYAGVLMDMIEAHVERAGSEPSNGLYSEMVLEKAKALQWLIAGGSGVVTGVVSSSLKDVKGIAQMAFGAEIAEDQIDTLSDYSLTVFPGLLGRIRSIGHCRTDGELVALDFLGAGD